MRAASGCRRRAACPLLRARGHPEGSEAGTLALHPSRAWAHRAGGAMQSRLLELAGELEQAGDAVTAFYARLAAVAGAPESTPRGELEPLVSQLEQQKETHAVDTADPGNEHHVKDALEKAFARGVRLDSNGQHKKAVKACFRRVPLLKRALEEACDGRVDEETAGKTRYASYRMKQVADALHSNSPIPPPPAPSEDQQEEDDAPPPAGGASGREDDGDEAQARASADGHQQAVQARSEDALPEAPPAEANGAAGNGESPSSGSWKDRALRSARFASSALMFEDVSTAKEYLQEAISLLSERQSSHR